MFLDEEDKKNPIFMNVSPLFDYHSIFVPHYTDKLPQFFNSEFLIYIYDILDCENS